MSLRLGVIGVGYLGRHHARIYSELEGAELTAVADADAARADEIAEKYGCRSFSQYADLLPLCDAVSVATPTTTHYAVAIDCLKANKDVLIEKPITGTLEEGEALIQEATRRNLVLQVGHLERFNPGMIAAENLIREPRFVESERLSPLLGRGTDVDVTLDLMIHDIDIVMSIVRSELTDVRAIGESVLTDKIDVAKAWLEFENGCKALVTASRLSPEKQRRLKVFQKDSFISVDYQNHEVRRYFKNGEGVSFDVLHPEIKEPLKEELLDFIHCVETRRVPKVSGREALDALRVVLKINEMVKAPRSLINS
jgi:predicted dehydrogenase